MESDGMHVRSEHDYIRPSSTFNLAELCATGLRDPFMAVGVEYHEASARRFADGAMCLVEFVPEPRNTWDHWAIALDIEGQRIGYLPRGAAWIWHDVVSKINREGMAVVTTGRISRSDGADGWTDIDLRIYHPGWAEVCVLAEAAGLRDEHNDLLNHLSEADTAMLVSRCWDPLTARDVELFYARRKFAPSLRWSSDVQGRQLALPYWHIQFLRQASIEDRQRRKALRDLRGLIRREIRRRANAPKH